MANIKPMVAVAADLLATSPKEDYRFHFCIYHSQFPLAVRSYIENKLDKALQRTSAEHIPEQKEIASALRQYPEKNQVFIVLATPVVEVGRDHDYDWAIAEPSSMRSIIQLAGRVQRHRGIEPECENIVILNRNIKALMRKSPAYCRPGFESQKTLLNEHDLSRIVATSCYKTISATPRIVEPDFADNNNKFVAIEHKALINILFRDKEQNACSWWLHPQAHLFGEMQVRLPFRSSQQTANYFLFVDEDGECTFRCYDENAKTYVEDSRITPWDEFVMADRNQAWLQIDVHKNYAQLATMLTEPLDTVSAIYGITSLQHKDGEQYLYHPLLGIFSGSYLDND